MMRFVFRCTFCEGLVEFTSVKDIVDSQTNRVIQSVIFDNCDGFYDEEVGYFTINGLEVCQSCLKTGRYGEPGRSYGNQIPSITLRGQESGDLGPINMLLRDLQIVREKRIRFKHAGKVFFHTKEPFPIVPYEGTEGLFELYRIKELLSYSSLHDYSSILDEWKGLDAKTYEWSLTDPEQFQFDMEEVVNLVDSFDPEEIEKDTRICENFTSSYWIESPSSGIQNLLREAEELQGDYEKALECHKSAISELEKYILDVQDIILLYAQDTERSFAHFNAKLRQLLRVSSSLLSYSKSKVKGQAQVDSGSLSALEENLRRSVCRENSFYDAGALVHLDREGFSRLMAMGLLLKLNRVYSDLGYINLVVVEYEGMKRRLGTFRSIERVMKRVIKYKSQNSEIIEEHIRIHILEERQQRRYSDARTVEIKKLRAKIEKMTKEEEENLRDRIQLFNSNFDPISCLSLGRFQVKEKSLFMDPEELQEEEHYNDRGVMSRHSLWNCFDTNYILKRFSLNNARDVGLFVNEYKALSRIESPNIVDLKYLVEDRNHKFSVFLCMEQYKGGTLSNWIARKRNESANEDISDEIWFHLWTEVLGGIADIHYAGIVHRLINAENIVVSMTDKPSICNFQQSCEEGAARFTGKEVREERVTWQTDMIAFGVMMASLMTRQELDRIETLRLLVQRCIGESGGPPSAREALSDISFTVYFIERKNLLEGAESKLEEQKKQVSNMKLDLKNKEMRLLTQIDEADVRRRDADKKKIEAERKAFEAAENLKSAKKIKDDAEKKRLQAEERNKKIVEEEMKVKKRFERLESKERGFKELQDINVRPDYWENHFSSKKSQRFDVTNNMMEVMTNLMEKCSDMPRSGTGRDVRVRGQYTSLRIAKIWRVENQTTWLQYQIGKRMLRERKKKEDNVNVATDFSTMTLNLDSDINEKYLFHGTPHENIEPISRDGLDERFCKLSGLYGAGIYFAEIWTKSDQYSIHDPQGFYYMFVCRVALGKDIHQKQSSGNLKNSRTPPKLTDGSGMYNSVVASQHAKFREFIVYDKRQCYPEFLVKYERM